MLFAFQEGVPLDAHGKCFGGGGSSTGEIGYPAYLEQAQEHFLRGSAYGAADTLDNSVFDAINAAHGVSGNPYEGETSFDPNAALTLVTNSPLKRMSDQFDVSNTILTAFLEETLWPSYVSVAATAAKNDNNFSTIDFLDSLATAISGMLSAVSSALSDASITNMVTAFENNKKVRYLRDVGLWSAGMADINAVHTSSFMMGLAVQQIEFANSVDQYERELKVNTYTRIVENSIATYLKAQTLRISNQDTMLINGTQMMGQLRSARSQLAAQLTQLKTDIEKATIIAKKEQVDRQLAIDADEAVFDLEVFMYGANMLSAISGSAAGRRGPQVSREQSALGGALAGASIGASFTPLGAAIGAVAGGILGWALN